MRRTLISAAIKLETTLIMNKINIGVDMEFETPMGLKIVCRVEQPIPDKPSIFYFTYSVNSDKLKTWIQEHPYLDDMWRIRSRGINMLFSGGSPEEYHKVLYYIKHEENKELPEMYLDLLVKECVFAAHRDVFSNEEWVVSRVL